MNSCFNCNKRVLGCHSWCEDHEKDKRELENMKELQKEDKIYIGYCKDSHARMTKERAKRIKYK